MTPRVHLSSVEGPPGCPPEECWRSTGAGHVGRSRSLAEGSYRSWQMSLTTAQPGAPAAVHDKSNPDWAPILNFGHKNFVANEPYAMKSMERYERLLTRKKGTKDLDAARGLLQLHKEGACPEVLTGAVQACPEMLTGAAQACLEVLAGAAQVCPKVPADAAQSCPEVPTEDLQETLQKVSCASQTELSSHLIGALQDEFNHATVEKVNLQQVVDSLKFTENFFKDDDKKVKFYTGLHRYIDLMDLFDFIKSHITITSKTLTPFQMMIMTLMKLRHNFPVQDLAYRFNISSSSCSIVILRILDILYRRTS
ncbi:uncharacterized protein LOC127004259 isoform X2 [Eriocheir sinensis]|uniref:uncharacterized protein LOC127004259 isoform X2 n=1 Tax=Eriocheir sinensis TaxID=95602 RepID=UPI0021C98CEF|nr:uncharacterized protein LOC127004259 isoform X2 [Eriocheir sinensis]